MIGLVAKGRGKACLVESAQAEMEEYGRDKSNEDDDDEKTENESLRRDPRKPELLPQGDGER